MNSLKETATISAPINCKTDFSMRFKISSKEDAEKIKNEIASVNMIDVLLFLLR